MYYLRTLPETQAAPPTTQLQTAGVNLHLLEPLQLPHQNYTVSLQHQQQPLYHSPYPINPVFSHSHYNFVPIQSHHGGNESYAPHAGYGRPVYPYADAETSSVAFGVAVDGVHGHGPVDSRTISAWEAIRQPGGHTVSYIAVPHNCFMTDERPYQNTLNQPGFEDTEKFASKKISKVMHSALYCRVCKLDCNSQDALKSHKLGKKHKKNLKKLQASITPRPACSAEIAVLDGEHESNEKKKKKKRKSTLAENEFDLKMKRTRVLEAGGSADEVRVCSICNVVANSRKVYDDHVAGQKHAAMEAKLQESVVG